ncbi:hypothetical protein H7849_16070 [Alloacidobacterium dinghuense]|uniref:Uncharacterized protein n=1 Tax=Alloacidobacterium dinghuense TaxID=2763107 RepID=A0A7G8BDM6_9BACT|nr:hypothetical protein [Alloacidobacterium dinghuense]QNI30646.1 hypothetical protein H7849_16070 [Alloacidobacterium dinghuense]
MVYMLAVERRHQDFVPAEKFSRTATERLIRTLNLGDETMQSVFGFDADSSVQFVRFKTLKL